MQFSFDNFMLDVDRRELRRGAAQIALEPQVFDLLLYLLEHRDRVVSRDELIARSVGRRVVSDSTLASRINAARQAIDGQLGRTEEAQRYLQEITRVRPVFSVDFVRTMHPFSADMGTDRYFEGLRKAGVPETRSSASTVL